MALTSSASQISIFLKTYRGLDATVANEARLPAYVSLSMIRTSCPRSNTKWRHTADPMKPAPPVTMIRMVTNFHRRIERLVQVRRGADWLGPYQLRLIPFAECPSQLRSRDRPKRRRVRSRGSNIQ